jgi:hypothetical protein
MSVSPSRNRNSGVDTVAVQFLDFHSRGQAAQVDAFAVVRRETGAAKHLPCSLVLAGTGDFASDTVEVATADP